MSTDAPNELDVAHEIIGAAVGRVRTMIPARVLAYDQTTQTATVQIAIRTWEVDADTGELRIASALPPPMAGVRVGWLSGAGGSITFPITVGDWVTLYVYERSTDEWRATGASDNSPADPRRFDLTDVLAVPMGGPTALGAGAVDPAAMVVAGTLIKLGSSTATSPVALGTPNDADWTALKTAINGWTPVAGDGGAALKVILTALIGTGWPQATGATKVRAE